MHSLGRWVHYQRVEYWIFQQKGTAKITVERIARLNNIGFEWGPQKAQWEKMFAKLKEVRKPSMSIPGSIKMSYIYREYVSV